jgi:catechol 2,3-dioxygenase-like lactoylglutathione lyase family enzyme
MNLGIDCLGHVAIYVADLDRSVEFYRKVVGLKVTGMWPPPPPPSLAGPSCFMRIENMHHNLVLKELPSDYDRLTHDTSDTAKRGYGGVHHLAFGFNERENWLNALDHVRSCGVEIARGPEVNGHEAHDEKGNAVGSGSHAFYFCDPDGYRVEFYCWMMNVTRPSAGAPNPDL